MEDIYANVENDMSVKTRPLGMEPGPRSSERSRHGAVVLGLVLLSVLLLAGLICLGVHYHDAAAQLSTIKANVTDLMEERNQLKTNVTDLIEERNQLKTNVTEIQMLLKQKKACPDGWRRFGCSCYLLSSQSGPWTDGRDDCRSRDAHLVVIDSSKEQQTSTSSCSSTCSLLTADQTSLSRFLSDLVCQSVHQQSKQEGTQS
ncbi:C-type lectin domain family 12 member B-like isoform X3 [Betta splendens]|uniref:C-type lectin domain family 12 member B-like isoform X3 n=1 Tax=Betta splendens TaxID=158456 RepID=A0A9W2XHQ7_BETSP|nr:C-type lectin domain family 12 member B-like isoform X3 [Betta splendens]